MMAIYIYSKVQNYLPYMKYSVLLENEDQQNKSQVTIAQLGISKASIKSSKRRN